MTDLEAVNGMLALIGEAPVTTINDTGQADVNLATQMIRNNMRQIMVRGWSFNVDKEYTITKDASGFINVPTNALAIAPSRWSGVRAVQRGSKMWDLDNQTFVWTKDLSLDIVWFQPFNELPDHARQMIFAAASVDFAKSQMASSAIVRSAMEEFTFARKTFLQVERRITKPNVFSDSSTALDLIRDPNYHYIPGR